MCIFRRVTIQAIPDRSVMIDIIDRIVEFEEKLKHGESLTRVEEREKRTLEPVARELKKAQKRESTTVKRVNVGILSEE